MNYELSKTERAEGIVSCPGLIVSDEELDDCSDMENLCITNNAQIDAAFRILLKNHEDGKFYPLTSEDLNGIPSPGSFVFIVDGEEITFDFNTTYHNEEDGVFCYYGYDLVTEKNNWKSIEPGIVNTLIQKIANADSIKSFFVWFENKEGKECECGNFEFESDIHLELLHIILTDECGNDYVIKDNVLQKQNNPVPTRL